MRQLLVGPAGAGKTCRVLEVIQDYLARGEGHKLLVLLPTESLTSHFQALLLDNGKLKGFTGQFLFTFHSLSYSLVSQKKNFTLARPHQKILLLEEVLQKNCPPYFAGVKTHRGFRQALLKSFKELKEQPVDPAGLEHITASFQGRWSGKSLERFYALLDIYKYYQKALQERGWEDGEDLLFQAAHLIKEDANILKEKELLIVDGFYNFTPHEKLILENLLKKVPQTLITLTTPGKKGGTFEPVQQTMEFLAPHRLKKNILETPHRFAASALKIIAENFLADGSGPKSAESPDGLKIWEAPDRHAEVEAVAQEIMYLVHRQGFDFADIGIILRQPASYLTLFRETFNLLHIPWRYWGKEPLTASPEVKTALELGNLLALGWERERVFRLLKSGYFDLELAEVDAWEQKAEQHPLENEKAWREFLASVKNSSKGIQDTGAKKVAGGLMERAREFRGKDTGTAWAEKFRGVVEEFILPGAVRAVGRSRQPLPLAAVERFLSVLEEVGRFGPPAEITFAGFLEALSLAVNAAEIFRPDPRRHAVNLIGVHEARQWELPAVFVVGLVEGEFPAPAKEDLFIKDYQRKTLGESQGLNLPLSSTWAEEEMLFYFAATRAQQRLYLTYPAGGASRKDFLPSTFIEEVKTLFTAPAQSMPVTQLSPLWECPPAEKIYSVGSLSLFTLGHKDETGEEGQIARWILTHDRQHSWSHIASLPQYQGFLSGVPTEGVRGSNHIFSVSELETFAQCPRAYFCQYILGLEPLALTYAEDLEYSFWGILAHRILELYYRSALQNAGRGVARRAPIDISSLLEEVLAQTPEAGAQNYLFLREKELLRRNLTGFLEREKTRSRLYPFKPQALEWSFGKNTPPLTIEGGEAAPIHLSGKIDRLDVGHEDQKCAAVVDYKYSRQSKNLKERIEAGLELQLPLYILAAQELLGYKPAGGVLYYLKKSTLKPESFEDMAAMGREGLWPSAFGGKKVFLLEEQPWRETMQQVKAQVRELVTRLQAGDIRPTPEQAEYCGPKRCQFFELCPLREREAPGGGGEDNERD